MAITGQLGFFIMTFPRGVFFGTVS